MPLDTLDPRHLSDLAYTALRTAIVSGELEPGSRLSQDDLALQLGVSRAPVRDALNRLEVEGFVRTTNRKWAVVAEMTAQELLDIFEVRILVDGCAARKACELLGEEELLQLQQIAERASALLEAGQISELVQTHTDFHYVIYAASGNAELNRIARNLWDRSFRYRVAGLSSRKGALASVEDHRAILQALKDRNPLQAEKLMVKHNQDTIDRLLRQMKASSEG